MELVSTFFADTALMKHSPRDTLRIVRMLLENPLLWAQGARARDAQGKRVKPHDPKAVCWSVNGALAIASNSRGITPPSMLRYLDSIVKEWGMVAPVWLDGPEIWEGCDVFNDERPHRFILALLDEAIARLETPCSTGNRTTTL
jgi:hypothetical protein